MPDESEDSERAWLLEPLGPDEVRIHVEVGEGVELSPELREALDSFVRELQASEVEVEGFAVPCPDLSDCEAYGCLLGKCQPQQRFPCAWDEKCHITKFGSIF